jgi:hypothetical protein
VPWYLGSVGRYVYRFEVPSRTKAQALLSTTSITLQAQDRRDYTNLQLQGAIPRLKIPSSDTKEEATPSQQELLEKPRLFTTSIVS